MARYVDCPYGRLPGGADAGLARKHVDEHQPEMPQTDAGIGARPATGARDE